MTLNRGSATLKSTLYDAGNQDDLLLSISIDHGGGPGADDRLLIADPAGQTLLDSAVDSRNTDGTLEIILAWLDEHGFLSELAAVGHRIVHGGSLYTDPQRITAEVLSNLEQLTPLDPDHMPAAIAGIKIVARQFPDVPQVACFDTAFHSTLPSVARLYALPGRLRDQGIRRYGFHGLSYEYVMHELRALDANAANGRVIVAHLGSGASMVAVKEGKSVDTSMGFTPLEGLVMGTRSGDVDPGALLYLLEHGKMSATEIGTLLNKESGLLGVSGTSADMRTLLQKMPQDGAATEAFDLFCYRAKKYIGAYTAVLGGLDMLVFAGGIGEHAPAVRQRICDNLDFLGICLDGSRNGKNAAVISAPESRVQVRVINTNEDLMIVRHVLSMLGWRSA